MRRLSSLVQPEQIVTWGGLFCFALEDFHETISALQDALQQ